MGFFDSLFKSTPVTLTITDPREAFISILFACAAANGNLSDDEVDELGAFITTKNHFLRGAKGITFITKARDNIRVLGGSPKALVETAAKGIPADLRETTLFYAVDIILADGVVDKEESQILDFLKEALQVDSSTAQKISEVALLKNKIR